MICLIEVAENCDSTILLVCRYSRMALNLSWNDGRQGADGAAAGAGTDARRHRHPHGFTSNPAAVIVHQLAVHTVGGVVSAADPIMLIVPEGKDLALAVQIAPKDIDQI